MTDKTHEAIVEDEVLGQATTEAVAEAPATEEAATVPAGTPEAEKPKESQEKGEVEEEEAPPAKEEPKETSHAQNEEIAEYEKILAAVFDEKIATVQHETQRKYFENLEGSYVERMKEFEKMKAAGFIQFETAGPKLSAQEHEEIGSVKLPAFPDKKEAIATAKKKSAKELIAEGTRSLFNSK